MRGSGLSFEDVLMMVEEERRAARRVVEELLGDGAVALLEELRDYRAFGRHVSFYVRSPGCVDCMDAGRLLYGVRVLFGIDNPKVYEAQDNDYRGVRVTAAGFELGVTCYRSARGCQAGMRVNLRNIKGCYECKISCYPYEGGDARTAVALALLLAYANVPPEHGHPYWSAETG